MDREGSPVEGRLQACASLCQLLGVEMLRLEWQGGDASPGPSSQCSAFCALCNHPHARRYGALRYGLYEAQRQGGSYCFYCRMGVAFCVAEILDEAGESAGGVVVGPFVLGEVQEVAAYTPDGGALTEALLRLPRLADGQAEALSTVLTALTTSRGRPSPASGGSEHILSTLHDMQSQYHTEEGSDSVILQAESAIQEMIRNGDQAGTQKLLDELLGYLYFHNSDDLATVKARSIALLVVLSRSMIAAGADAQAVIGNSSDDLQRLGALEEIDDIRNWLAGAMQRFLACFDQVEYRQDDLIYKTMRYIRDNWQQSLSLEQIAGHVYLSKSYLSSLFRQKTGMRLTWYINKVRVEKSKELLAQSNISLAAVAHECCFQDQSYFTKVFRAHTGMSPKQFRASLPEYR